MSQITAPTRDFFFGFELKLTKQIIKINNITYRILITSDSLSYYNKMNFKGYKLNSLVFPTTVITYFSILNHTTNSNQEFSHQTPFQLTEQILIDTIIIDSTKNAYYEIASVNLNFSYSEYQKTQFDNTSQSIIGLENLKPELYAIRSKLKELENIKMSVVRIYNIDLKNIEDKIQKINPHKLITDNSDVKIENEGVIPLYDSLTKATIRMRQRFDNMILRPEFEYFSDGYHAYKAGEYQTATSNFLKSISQKPGYPPPYYYLAEMAFEQQLMDSAARTTIYILNNLEPDFTIQKYSLELCSKIYNSLVDKASSNINSRNINEAVSFLELALILCDSIKDLACNSQAQELMQKAKQEMFDSWVFITKKSISNKKTALAINYIRWTQAFLDENKGQIKDSSQLDSLKLQLAKLLLYSAKADLHNKSFEAEKFINFADSLGRNLALNSIVIQADSLSQKLKIFENIVANDQQQNSEKATTLKNNTKDSSLHESGPDYQFQYDQFIKFGIEEFNAERFSNAFKYFLSAKDLETKSGITKNRSLDSLFKNSGKTVILKDLENGDMPAWGFHNEIVLKIIENAKQDALKLGLENDSDINNSIHALEEKAYKNKCHQKSTEFTANLQTASKSITLANYRSAYEFWEKALKICTENPDCKLDRSIPSNLIEKYKKPIKYQLYQDSLFKSLEKKNDSLSFNFALIMSNLYKYDSLEGFRVEYYSPEIIVEKYNTPLLHYFLLKYYIQTSQVNKSVSEISKVLSYADIGNQYSSISRKAVSQLAKSDFKENKADPKQLAKTYFPKQPKLQKLYLRNFN